MNINDNKNNIEARRMFW